MTKSRKILLIIASLFGLLIVASAVVTIVFIRYLRVPTGSMMNTIIPGDRVLAVRYVGNLERGDVVVFKFPPKPQLQYIMRVIGLPGETILLRGTKVLINGEELAEARTYVELVDDKSPLPEISREGEGRYRVYYTKRDDESDESDESDETMGQKYAVKEPFLIPPDHYFVLGDSRDNSLDSRYWGTVPRELMIGRCLMIVDSEAPGGEERVFIPLK
jgi:signal peptidase I